MVFYQRTINALTKDMLLDAILQNATIIEHFHFGNYPTVKTLSDALDIIEEKRNILVNPHNHTFLCLFQ